MTYTGAMVLPQNAVVLPQDEMRYVEGGATLYVNKNRCGTIATYVYGAGFGITASVAIASINKKLTAVGSRLCRLASKIGAALGPVGSAIGLVIAALAVANLVSFLNGVITADRKNTGVKMTWYGAAFSNKKYY